jgi:hypothetical protein
MKTKVADLLRQISEKTCVHSFHIPDQPQLLKIIALGDEAVPFLLEHLKVSKEAELARYRGYEFYEYAPWYAFAALREITGADPMKPEHAGRLYDIIDDWLAWKP